MPEGFKPGPEWSIHHKPEQKTFKKKRKPQGKDRDRRPRDGQGAV
jgi:hypothetical protein